MITLRGYSAIMKLDSKRDIKVLLTLMELGEKSGVVVIKQSKLADMVGLKNQANVNASLNNLIKADCIAKQCGKQITYYINPKLFVTRMCYEDAIKKYNAAKEGNNA